MYAQHTNLKKKIVQNLDNYYTQFFLKCIQFNTFNIRNFVLQCTQFSRNVQSSVYLAATNFKNVDNLLFQSNGRAGILVWRTK